MKMYLIANLIANESSTTKKMQPHKFIDATKPIFRMAAIEFTKAVFETGFTENLYEKSDYDKLESGIDKVCDDLKI